MERKYYFLIGFLVLVVLVVGGILIFTGDKDIQMSPGDEECDYVGEVEGLEYCDSSGSWVELVVEGEVCLNDYECLEKSCIDEICQDKYSSLDTRSWLENIKCFLPNYCCADKCAGTYFKECIEGNFEAAVQISGVCDYGGPEDPPGSCFPGYTLISMKDNSQKQIKDIEVNDEVLSYDLESNEFVYAKVLELESPIREGFYSINNLIDVTDEHPFYIKKDGVLGWGAINALHAKQDSEIQEEILNLEIGDFLFDGNWVEVKSIEYFPGLIQTYNLKTVDKYNNFFANNFLVHNKGSGCSPIWECSDWSNLAGSCGTRVCISKNRCYINKPSESEDCPGVEPFCGDGVCASNEDCSSCEADCGGCSLIDECDVAWLWWLLLILLVVYLLSILTYYLYKRYKKKKELGGEDLDKNKVDLIKKPTAQDYSKNLDGFSNNLLIPPVSSQNLNKSLGVPLKSSSGILPKRVIRKNIMNPSVKTVPAINLNKPLDDLLVRGNNALMKKNVLGARAFYNEIKQKYNPSADSGNIYRNKIKEFYSKIISFRSS